MKKGYISFSMAFLLSLMAVGTNIAIVSADSNVTSESGTTAEPNEIVRDGDVENQWILTDDGTLHILGGDNVIASLASLITDGSQSMVVKISFDGKTIAPQKMDDFFKRFDNLEEIDNLKNLDTSKTTDMSEMFSNLSNLKTVDLSQLNVSNVTDMTNMFQKSGIEKIEVPNWDVRNVKKMNGMFMGSMVKNVDVSNWQVNSLTKADMLFSNIPSLTSIKMFKDFKNITSVDKMFYASNVKDFDAKDWNMSNVKSAQYMFGQSNIQTLDASNWDLSNASDLTAMLFGMHNLTSVNVSDWKFPTQANMDYLFYENPSLKKLDLSTWHNLGSSFEYGLAATGITQIKVAADTELTNSHFSTVEDEDTDIITDENGEPLYSGYLIKTGQPDTNLIAAKDFTTGADGTYNYVNSSEITATANIESNRGTKNTEVTLTGDLTREVDVKVPKIDGATSDKETVKGKVVATTDDDEKTVYSIKIIDSKGAGYVTYTGGDSGNTGGSSGSGGSGTSKPEVTNVKRLVAVHADNEEVALYQKDMSKVSDRALAGGSDWYSDQQMVKNGETYYRVATNEWVKASDTYVYESHSGTVNTKSNGYQALTTSKGRGVNDRALAANTAWKIDRLAYINGDQYYRVATNEFVPVSEVTRN